MHVPRTHRRSEEDGASAVEYGLLVAGIAALVVVVVFALGGAVSKLFGTSCGTIGAKMTSRASVSCS